MRITAAVLAFGFVSNAMPQTVSHEPVSPEPVSRETDSIADPTNGYDSNLFQPEPNATALIRRDEAKVTEAAWGQMRALFMGETHGSENLFSAYMTVKPGQAVHKAHRHAEEEYMVLVEGEGRWHLEGKEVPARTGDVVYTAAWAMHGLTNTSDKPLTFFVIKWKSRGVAAPPKPAGPDEEK